MYIVCVVDLYLFDICPFFQEHGSGINTGWAYKPLEQQYTGQRRKRWKYHKHLDSQRKIS
jgi:hypothetical protein